MARSKRQPGAKGKRRPTDKEIWERGERSARRSVAKRSRERRKWRGARRVNPPTPVKVQKFRQASGHLVSGQVISLQYVNIGSAQQRPYSHPFEQDGVEMWALANGSLLIRHPRFRLWEDQLVGDGE